MKIEEQLKELPISPGVYIMKGPGDKIIYIGKANSLKNRIKSYFSNTSATNHYAAHVLKNKTHHIDWVVTGNEKEALLLEANLVKKHSPKYNVLLKDDKHFPYIGITLNEPFPRLHITRHVENKNYKYFGPYTDVKSMRKTIGLMYKIFRIRDCNLILPLKEPIKPCLSYHIGRCDAPCANMISSADYKVLVKEAMLLLKGNNHELIKELEGKMKALAKNKDFELAGKIRDQLRHIESMLDHQRIDLGEQKPDKDVIAIVRDGHLGCVVIMVVREGIVIDRKSFEVACPLEQTESEVMTEFIKQYYCTIGEAPSEIILSHAAESDENLESLFEEIHGKKVWITLPKQGAKKKQVDLASKNARMKLIELISKREKKTRINYAVQSLKEDLQLKKEPQRIEAFDISHLSGTDTVASLVVFKNGLPFKSDYRKYNVKTVEGIDDFASMKEVVERRVKRLLDEKKEMPDLFLIDGGKGQLGMAKQILDKYGLYEQPVIGLAKRLEEVFVPGVSNPLYIAKSSASLKLLQHVRDESHRFAITFQKSKRKKYVTRSWLDDIKGIGPVSRKKLIGTFKTHENIKNADLSELSKCIGPNLANLIHSFCQNQKTNG